MLKTQVEHEGVTYDAETAVIRETDLGWEDHGIFTFMLHVDYSSYGGSTGIGGIVLDGKPTKEYGDRVPTALGMAYIVEVMRILGVRRWEDLRGQQMLVLFDQDQTSRAGMGAVGIANRGTGEALIFAHVGGKLGDDSTVG